MQKWELGMVGSSNSSRKRIMQIRPLQDPFSGEYALSSDAKPGGVLKTKLEVSFFVTLGLCDLLAKTKFVK